MIKTFMLADIFCISKMVMILPGNLYISVHQVRWQASQDHCWHSESHSGDEGWKENAGWKLLCCYSVPSSKICGYFPLGSHWCQSDITVSSFFSESIFLRDPYDMRYEDMSYGPHRWYDLRYDMSQLRWKSEKKVEETLAPNRIFVCFLVPGALLQWVGVESLAGEFSDGGGWNGGWTHMCQGFLRKPREWVSKLSIGKKWSWNFWHRTARCWRRWLFGGQNHELDILQVAQAIVHSW